MNASIDTSYIAYLIRRFHRKLNAEGSNGMLLDDDRSLHSSVGSNNVSQTPFLVHFVSRHTNTNFPFYPLRRNKGTGALPKLGDDALVKALMDTNYPTEGLENYEEWTLDLRKLAMGESFDEGTFGKLFRGKYNGEEVAVKILGRPADSVVAEALERQFQQEVMALAVMNHPNVVRFIGACRKPMVWVIVTVYAKGGSVRKFLQNRQNRQMPLKLVIKQALDIARGMAYMHGLGLVHRDLKSNNLLIAADRSIKIADFGFARIQGNPDTMTTQAGTYRWMSPEMIQNFPCTQRVDVYSFGIVLWELITGSLPYQEMKGALVPYFVVRGRRPPIPNDCLPVLSEILCRCWDSNADARPSFAEVVNMLENAQTEIFTTVRKARFRRCITQPAMIIN